MRCVVPSGQRRSNAAISASVLQQLSLGAIALEIGVVLFDRAPHMARPTFAEIAQAVLGVVLSSGVGLFFGIYPAFRAANPGIDVRISTSMRMVDFVREDMDLAIRYGLGT